MQRSFLLNFGLVLVLNLLVKPFYILGIDAGVQRAVGSAAYGTYAALLSLGFLLNIVLDLGMTNQNTRHIAQHTAVDGRYAGKGLAAGAGAAIAVDDEPAVDLQGAGLVVPRGVHGACLK